MDGGAVAILFNRGEEAATIRADWKMLGLMQGRVYEVSRIIALLGKERKADVMSNPVMVWIALWFHVIRSRLVCHVLAPSRQVRDLWTKANTRMSAEGDGSLEAHVRTQPSSQYSIIWHVLSNMQRSTDCSARFRSLARGLTTQFASLSRMAGRCLRTASPCTACATASVLS